MLPGMLFMAWVTHVLRNAHRLLTTLHEKENSFVPPNLVKGLLQFAWLLDCSVRNKSCFDFEEYWEILFGYLGIL